MTDERMGFPPRSSWGPGPWDNEPDELDWRDERTGLPCAIRRNPFAGQLNGYVGVPPTHPLFGWNYDDSVKLKPEYLERPVEPGKDIGIVDFFCYALSGEYQRGTMPVGMLFRVHHGVNFSGVISGEGAERYHWFGFDCGHAWDLSPGLNASIRDIPGVNLELLMSDQTYRTIDYVKAECTKLAVQLKQLEAMNEYVLLSKDANT